MQHRFRFVGRIAATSIIATLLTACGGGGGGSSSTPSTPPPVTSTPGPLTVLVPGKQSTGGGAGGFANDGRTPSAYTITSNPSGQSFTLAGQTYTTPATVTPSASNAALTIAFASGFTVPIVQVYDGPHTVFYNAASDSTGTVAVSSLQSIRRQAAGTGSAKRLAAAHRSARGAHRLTSEIDPTRVAVRMSSAALRTSGRSPADVERAAGSVGHDTPSATADRLRVVTVPQHTDRQTFIRQLQAQPEVAEVTPVHIRHLLARAPTTVSDQYAVLPLQWNLFATGANYAWSYNPGTGVKLAIIDTGIDDNNTDLTSQLAFQETAVTPIDNTPTAANGGNPTCLPLSGQTTVVTPNTAQDDNGHGTNVAGIAIAKQDTVGFAGEGWGAKLLAFKIFADENSYCNSASGSISNYGASSADEAQAIGDAVAQGADVISLSLGAASLDTFEFNAIESAIAAGVTVVAAAGNSEDASGPGTLDYPAAYPGVISVGASALKDQYFSDQQPQNVGTYSTSTEVVASYSQYSPALSVVAPGGEASGCVGTGAAAVCDQDYLHWIANYSTSTAFLTENKCSTPVPATSCAALFSGTSMATPQVAATAAMLLAEAGGRGKLSPAQIKYTIETTADNINDSKQGHGRLNAYRALASLVRDTSAYSGPVAQVVGTAQLVAFAYSTGNTNRPSIVDASFPAGVPVNADGTFRIADVPVATGAFGVAVWYDANGDGVVDAGDQIGTAPTKCSPTTACQIGTISLHAVNPGYFLP